MAVAAASPHLRDTSSKPLLIQSIQVPSRPPAILALDARAVPDVRTDRERDPRPRRRRGAVVRAVHERVPAPATGHARHLPGGARLLAAAGIRFPDGGLAGDDAGGADRGGHRCAGGAEGRLADLLHKTDAGRRRARRRSGGRGGRAAAMRGAGRVPLDGVFVERQAAAGGVGLVVGPRRDPTSGRSC